MSTPPQPPPPPPAGPPGQPGGPYGGQGGWGYGPPPPSQKTSGLAIAAFVLSLLCIPLIPIVLGVIALSQIRSRGTQGRGLAIAAIAISSVTLVISVVTLVLGVLVWDAGPVRDDNGRVTRAGEAEARDIRVGDCFTTDKGLSETVSMARIVPCSEPHKGEAYAALQLENGPYPGESQLGSLGGEKCSGTVLTDYVGAAKVPEKLQMHHYGPTSDGWDDGDRTIICFFGDPTGTTTGSVRDG